MMFCSILALPAIAFCYYGSRVSSSDRDFFGIYQFMIGNIGHDIRSSTYLEDAACDFVDISNRTSKFLLANETCINVFGNELDMLQVAGYLTVSEVLQCLMMAFVVWLLRRRTTILSAKADINVCTVTDYSVVVSGLPAVTDHQELLTFFSDLYPLDKADWRGRPPVSGALPVENVMNTNNNRYLGTWVAELFIFHKMGAFIHAFKDKEKLTEKLLRSRAMIKMYSEGTKHIGGHNEKLRRYWENKMLDTGAEIEKITLKVMNNTRNDIVYNKKIHEEEKLSQKRKPKESIGQNDTSHPNGGVVPSGPAGTPPPAPPPATNKEIETYSMEGPAVTAFLVFNHCESKARCIEDFARYSQFPFNLFYPEELKFNGHKLHVKKAPEPDEILWENLETTTAEKWRRQTLTAVVTVLCLLLGFIIILQSSIYKQRFNEDIPNLGLCDTEIPALFLQTYDTRQYKNPQLVRPTEKQLNETRMTLDELDDACDAVQRNTFFVVLNDYNGLSLADYDITRCTKDTSQNLTDSGGLCPVYGHETFCPCVSIQSTEKCKTLGCSLLTQGKECSDFPALTLGSCFCFQQLVSVLDSTDISSALSQLSNQEPQCNNFAVNYSIAVALTVVAAMTTVLINRVLKNVLKKLAINERHRTIDSEQGAIMIKIFIATYFNMAFVALLAFGKVDTLGSYGKDLQILQGDYPDFTVEWYPQVGTYMVLTFVFEIISPLLSVLAKYYIIYPLRRSMAYAAVVRMSSHKIAMQADLNALEVGNVFDASTHMAKCLALFFFAMTYSAGIPVLMPVCGLAFCLFFYIDRLLLCRFYQKPPKYGDAAMKLLLEALPFALLIRVGVGIWMLSNEEVLPRGEFSISALPDAVENISILKSLSDQYSDFAGDMDGYKLGGVLSLGSRITRPSILPLFGLFVMIVFYLLFAFIWPKLPIAWVVSRFMNCLRQCKKNRVHTDNRGFVYNVDLMNLKDPLRTEISPYTGEYYKLIEYGQRTLCSRCSKSKDEITKAETEDGWKGLYKDGMLSKCKTFLKPTYFGNHIRNVGAIKNTYEIVGDHGVFTYEISRIPQYKNAMRALKETMDLILSDEMDVNVNWNHHSSKTRGKNIKQSVMEEYENKRKQRILDEQKKKKQEWDKAVQKKRVSNETTREKTTALNPNLREAMYADEDDYNEVNVRSTCEAIEVKSKY